MFSRSSQVFAALTVVELVVFLFAASRVNVLLLILVVVALSVSGLVFFFRQTAGLIRESVEEVVSARNGAQRQLGDRALRVCGAALLAFPGLVTGLFGALLMLQPVRTLVRPLIGSRLARLVPTELSGPITDLNRAFRRRDIVDVDLVNRDPDGSPTNPSAPPELR